MTVLPLDLEAARRAAEAHRALRAEGVAIGAADRLIAGIALAHGSTLMTRNVREFGRVPGLVVQSP
jgi:tRNA(fMet)-specific endonuclease VapC